MFGSKWWTVYAELRPSQYLDHWGPVYRHIHASLSRRFLASLVKLHAITVYRTVLGEWAVVECHLLFSLVSLIVSCSIINRLLIRCLWPLVFVLNNILTVGMLHSAISHFPGCFCPWTFFKNIGFNMVPLDPLMSHLATQLGYSTGEFQALQLIVFASFGVVD